MKATCWKDKWGEKDCHCAACRPLEPNVNTRKRVTVRLTLKEAECMSYALGNSTHAPDAMEALFEGARERAAAYRAHAKLEGAIYSAKRQKVNHG